MQARQTTHSRPLPSSSEEGEPKEHMPRYRRLSVGCAFLLGLVTGGFALLLTVFSMPLMYFAIQSGQQAVSAGLLAVATQAQTCDFPLEPSQAHLDLTCLRASCSLRHGRDTFSFRGVCVLPVKEGRFSLSSSEPARTVEVGTLGGEAANPTFSLAFASPTQLSIQSPGQASARLSMGDRTYLHSSFADQRRLLHLAFSAPGETN